MSSRVFVRGAGVACLAAAVVGYTLATDDNNYLPRLPGDDGDADAEAGQKPFLRAPLPEPSFGAAATRLPSATGTSTRLTARRSELLGSASRLPVATGVATGPLPGEALSPIASVPDAQLAVAPQPAPVVPPPAGAKRGEVPSLAETFGLVTAPTNAGTVAASGETPEILPAPPSAEPRTPPTSVPPPAAAPAELLPSDPLPVVATDTVLDTVDESARSLEAPLAAPAPGPQPDADPIEAAPDPQPAQPREVVSPVTDALPALAAPEGDKVEPPVAAPPLPPPPPPVLASPPAVRTADTAQQVSPEPLQDPAAPDPAKPISSDSVSSEFPPTDPLRPDQPAATAPLAPIAPPTARSATTPEPAPAAPLAELVPAHRVDPILGLPGSGAGSAATQTGTDPAALTLAANAPFSGTAGTPLLSYQDELILELQVDNFDQTDTIIAYGTRGGLYLPLGAILRILDLAVTVTDEGRYAHGWILSEDRTLTIDLRSGEIVAGGKTIRIDNTLVASLDGEMYLRMDQFAQLFPVEVTADLRAQSVKIKTLETFPFAARREREKQREKLALRDAANGDRAEFDRFELPYRALSFPAADVELRAASDNIFGPRLEGDILLAGDVAYLSAEAYLSGDTKNGLVASLIKAGRMDPDAELLGPLKATAFALGDINSAGMALGLRSISGRGLTLTNAPSQATSVFDRVDLRGILPDGYEVELYRNDILVGSTRDAVNGQYEFLRIPVDFGLNVFRLVFFGPQGQRSETVQRISVGDGRVAKGKLVYAMDVAQRDENLLGVRPPNYVPTSETGNWRASAQLSYGLTSGLTGLLGGAFVQALDRDRWMASTGLRTSIAGLAVKADAGFAEGNAMALGLGVGGRFGQTAITASHTEYSGEFLDETKTAGQQFLRRATEIDINTNLGFGDDGFALPVSVRLRNYLDVDGRNTLFGGMRASTRLSGLLVSNTLEYARTTGAQIEANDQLYGNFDLATLSRNSTRARVSLGYQLMPETNFTNVALEIDHALDEKTSIRGVAGYDFVSDSPRFGISGVREFERFNLALDGNYSFADKSYYAGLRIGFSLGRDPLRGRMFVARPGLASSGGATLRAFRDLDGNGTFGSGDEPMPDVDFIAYNQTGTTDAKGVSRLTGLGAGRAISLQMDTTTLPDIDSAPAFPGLEVVPRAGRIHAIDYPVVALSEVEGMARFVEAGAERGVSGVRLQLVNAKGEVVAFARTELDGYYFFERIAPGSYRLQIDPEQLERLQLCPVTSDAVFVGHISEVVSRDLSVSSCPGQIARSGE